ncbi:flagellar basal body-associated FliL family protein [Aeromonas media]|uniref:flagellar basal body-associated FliL family protein n=1 Tax=Aeromonas TaxID=642 RepID=UPI000F9B6165|nr:MULTISPECIES: flagellar basal body-associated FliL family protein [Aeromonas]WED81296.1 flagellar basal body-associated FliL family protein [Aeromonas media]
MKIFRILLVLSLGCTLLNTYAFANEDAAADPASAAVQPGFAYHALDPDIITNYLGDGKTLGYVRVTVELMAENAADLKLLEQHDPLIRDAIIRLIGSKTGAQIKSLVSREELRKECEGKVNELLVRETGKKAVRELIFTKYLYQ